VFDLQVDSLKLVSKFRTEGLVSVVTADEDGNHLTLCLQRDNEKFGVRCLIDGTKRERVPWPSVAEMYGPKYSRSGKRLASGTRKAMTIEAVETDPVVFPHFYSHSYVWSPRDRFVAFFGRRWQAPPDFLWLYDLESARVHRAAAGEQFIPIYWT
jgi:hypothetical protein